MRQSTRGLPGTITAPADVAASTCDWMLGNYPPCEGDALHGSPLRPWEARMLRLHA